MQGQRGRSERHSGVFLDMVHLILGIAIVILAVLSFINPEGNHMLFPLVFLLAALLNAVNGIFELKTRGRDKKKFGASILQLALAAGLMVLGRKRRQCLKCKKTDGSDRSESGAQLLQGLAGGSDNRKKRSILQHCSG